MQATLLFYFIYWNKYDNKNSSAFLRDNLAIVALVIRPINSESRIFKVLPLFGCGMHY